MIPPVVADDFPLIFVLLMKHFGLFSGAVPSEEKRNLDDKPVKAIYYGYCTV